MNPGTCAWCRNPLKGRRSHARTCSKKCRQSAWYFSVPCETRRAADVPMVFAYADPPYPGLAARYYGKRPDYGGEVDHGALLSDLQRFDAFALSTSADALPKVLALCVERDLAVRVAAWVRGARGHGASARSRSPRSAWEPLIYYVGPNGRTDVGEWPEDVLTFAARTRPSEPEPVVGMKPSRFSFWMFDLLGARPGDEFHDLFPGSRGVMRAWEVLNSRKAPAPEVSGAAAPNPSDGAARDLSGTTSPKLSHLEVAETVGLAGSRNRRTQLERNCRVVRTAEPSRRSGT